MHGTLAALVACGLLAACSHRVSRVSPAADISKVQDAASQRTGHALRTAWTTGVDAGAIDAAAQELLRQPLTEASAVRIAILNNRSVRESYERLGIARADLVQAGLLPNPVLDVSAKFFSAGPEVEFGLIQSIVEVFRIPLRRCVAAAELRSAEAAVSDRLVALVFDVRRALLTLHEKQALVALRQEVLGAANASRELMRGLHEAGNVTDPLWTIEEMAASRAAIELADAQAERVQAREPINVLLGLKSGAVGWSAAGSLVEDSTRVGLGAEAAPAASQATAIETRALRASFGLEMIEADLAAARLRAGLARQSAAFPGADLGVVGSRESSDGEWGVGPEIGFVLPIFDQGQATTAAALAEVRAVLARRHAFAVQVSALSRSLEARSDALVGRVRALTEEYLPLRTRLVREIVQQYNAMQIGAFDVLTARQQLLDARREHVESLAAALRARLDLEQLLAGSAPSIILGASAMPKAAASTGSAEGH